MSTIHVSDTPQALAQAAAEFICSLAKNTIRKRGRFAIALSGGNTPRLTYERMRLTDNQPEWSRMYFFWSDERCVPPDHPDSNYRLARKALLAHIPIPAGNIHPMDCSTSPEAGAEAYESLLRGWVAANGEPAFDLVMLGLGDDGHTASLFPGTRALDEHERWVLANRVDRLGSWRMTLTYPALRASEQIIFLVQGGSKAPVVKAILEEHNSELPASAVSARTGSPHWYLDAASAALLNPAVRHDSTRDGQKNDG